MIIQDRSAVSSSYQPIQLALKEMTQRLMNLCSPQIGIIAHGDLPSCTPNYSQGRHLHTTLLNTTMMKDHEGSILMSPNEVYHFNTLLYLESSES